MLSCVPSAALDGLDATPIRIQVEVSSGLPGWQIVGLPEKTVQESKERVQSAIRNSGIELEPRKITVNLAPACHKKSGSHYDLPIAIGLLAAYGFIHQDLSKYCFLGELSLDGSLGDIKGALLMGLVAHASQQQVILPIQNAQELLPVQHLAVTGCKSLSHVLHCLDKGIPERDQRKKIPQRLPHEKDMADVKGQALPKRALEIAAAGGHPILLIGPPGTGKTMLAERFPGLLPPLPFEESLEVTKIYSATGELLQHGGTWIVQPPFRAPHHSISYAGLVGTIRQQCIPGELTLAHHGVLFLDEFPEFRRDVIESLRQPLESGMVSINRASGRKILPANIHLLAAMNPCQCGYLGHPKRACICNPINALRYRKKISGPILDRIDMHVEVGTQSTAELFSDQKSEESSARIRERVIACRQKQRERYGEFKNPLNAKLKSKQVEIFCKRTPQALALLKSSMESMHLSHRSYHRILKVARTIADLANEDILDLPHVAEALQFRLFDPLPY